MRKAFLLGLSLAAVSGMANAYLTNGSFETGDFTGWSYVTSAGGTANVVTNDSGFGPTDGNYFASLSADATLYQLNSWSKGDKLVFDWNFYAKDFLPFNDYSIFKVQDLSTGLDASITLANVMSTGSFSATGWNTYTYEFTASGFGQLEFSVFNALDAVFDSELYIDNAYLIPEPGSLALFGLGIGALVMARRKQSA